MRRCHSSTIDTLTLHLGCRMRWMILLSKVASTPLSAVRACHVSQPWGRIEGTAACKPCPLYAFMLHAERAGFGMGKINPFPDLFGIPAVCDENRPQGVKLVNIFRGVTIMPCGVALPIRERCWHHLGLRCFYIPRWFIAQTQVEFVVSFVKAITQIMSRSTVSLK